MARTGTRKNTIRCQATKKETRKEDLQDRETSLKGLNYNGNKKQASNGQRPSGMEQDCTGRNGAGRTVAL
jgi:hypothetical protein